MFNIKKTTALGAAILALLIFTCGAACAAPDTDIPEAYGEYYVFDGMRYPTVKNILESPREVISAESAADHKCFTYMSATNVDDMQLYINRLLIHHGFALEKNITWTPGAFLVISKLDDQGHKYYLESVFTANGYIITLWKATPPDVVFDINSPVYVFREMEYLSIAGALGEKRELCDLAVESDFERFTYTSATPAADLERYSIALIKAGYYLASEFTDFSAPGEYLQLQYPDTENNIFRNVMLEREADGYAITISAGYDMFMPPAGGF